MMKSDPFSEDLPGYVLGALDLVDNSGVERHLTECRECKWELEQFHAVMYLLAKSTPAMAPDAGLREKVIAGVVAAAGS
jgi:anti-sigma factor RsiW